MESPTVGIDVSKVLLDVAVWPTGESWQVPYDAAGLDALVEAPLPLAPQRVVVEATGRLEVGCSRRSPRSPRSSGWRRAGTSLTIADRLVVPDIRSTFPHR